METRQPSLDRISTLPENIIETILTLMPIKDALRTSFLSKKWRYSWRSMPKLVFADEMVGIQLMRRSKKYKLVKAIFHVLLLHNGPTILEVYISVGKLQMVSELDQIISYLARGTNVKELIVCIRDGNYNLPASFFSLQGLERMFLGNCGFKPPLTFNGFSRLREVVFTDVEVSAKMLQGFLSKCALLDGVHLGGYEKGIEITTGRNRFTFGDFFQCVPFIKALDFSKYYMKHLSPGGMPHKLPTSTHLKNLYLDVCLMELNEISSVLCMIRSSPLLVNLVLKMCDNEKVPIHQTPTNFLDTEGYSDWKLDHLEMFEINMFTSSLVEMEFVKLIMAKSPVLKNVRLLINENDVSAEEEVKMLRDWLLLPFPRASPSAKFIISCGYEG